MSNPKYADLPGIARDQPDVYETNELPESDQSHTTSDAIVDKSESVEQIEISTTDAYDKFKCKTLDARNVDFTDSIAFKHKAGYSIRSGEWEMLGGGMKEKETPIQAYNRLQYEVKTLLEEVHNMKETKDKSVDVPPATLIQQIEDIQKGLQNLHMEHILGSEAIQEITDPLGNIHDKILAQIDAAKKAPTSEKKPKPSSSRAPSADAFAYELYVQPEQTKIEETAKVAELEQRLRKLENVIGPDKSKLSMLTSNTDDKTVMAAVNVLSSKLNLLDPAFVEQMESRLMVLHQCLQQVSERKQQIDDVDKQNKIVELFQLAKKVEGLSSTLPQIVERLVALRELHEQALQFSKALTQLDTTQQQLVSSLKGNEILLRKVQESFIQNNEVITKNISSLNSRMDEFIKKT